MVGGSKDKLGIVLKAARQKTGMTRKEFAPRVQTTARHLMAIENGRQKPSYDLLYRLVLELYINANLIFHPELAHDRLKYEQASILLNKCGDQELDLVIPLLEVILRKSKTDAK